MNARKQRYGAEDLKAVFKGAKTVITGRGKKSQSFQLSTQTDWTALTKAALGPSGNLRAPAVKTGDTMLVGYCEPAWQGHFGDA